MSTGKLAAPGIPVDEWVPLDVRQRARLIVAMGVDRPQRGVLRSRSDLELVVGRFPCWVRLFAVLAVEINFKIYFARVEFVDGLVREFGCHGAGGCAQYKPFGGSGYAA
jgi:hypothetical protein